MNRHLTGSAHLLSTNRSSGFTLVEILVAMTVGIFLTGGILSLFVGTKQSYTANEAVSAVQENGRYLLEQMTQELRQSGTLGCQRTLMLQNTLPVAGSTDRLMQSFLDESYKIYNTLALTDPVNSDPDTDSEALAWWLYNLNDQAPIEGFDGQGGSFTTTSTPNFISITDLFVALGIDDASQNHDVVISRRVYGRPTPIIQHSDPASSLVVLSGGILKTGDVALASTCEHATVFQVTDILYNTPCNGLDTIEFKPLPSSHADYAWPGNQDYGNPYDPMDPTLNANINVSLGSRYANDILTADACAVADKSTLVSDTIGSVYPLRVNIYFVRDNDDSIPTLWVKNNSGASQQLINGVYGLQILYGTNSLAASCGSINLPNLASYQTADQVVNWNEVNAVKVSVLLGSTDESHGNIVDTSIQLPFPDSGGGTGVFDAASLSAEHRRRLFQVFTSTVFLRNKLPCLGLDQWTIPTGAEL